MSDEENLQRQIREGDQHALAEFFDRHRERLRVAVCLRMDARVRGRVDPSDVLQETFVEASGRLGEFRDEAAMTPYLWLRFLALQRVLIVHRRNLEAQARDARREVPLAAGSLPEVSSAVFAAQLMDSGTSPSVAAARAETSQRLEQALEKLEPMDREILALRHFEQMSNAESAAVLGVATAASSQRYYRALKRLKDLLATLPGGWSLG